MTDKKWAAGAQFAGNAAKRIQKELAELVTNAEAYSFLEAAPKGDNLYEWAAVLHGPPDSPYEDGRFALDIHFPPEYPFKPPRLTFKTRIYHCNINAQGGICLDILKNQWSPALTIAKVLVSLSSLLTDPNPHDPLVGDIARELIQNRKKHDQTARDWTRRYAIPKGSAAAPKPKTSPKKTKAVATVPAPTVSAATSSAPSSTTAREVITLDDGPAASNTRASSNASRKPAPKRKQQQSEVIVLDDD